MTRLLVITALRTEYGALRGHVDGARLERCGMGPLRARQWSPTAGEAPRAVVVAGLAGGLDPAVRPGDVLVASEVRDADGCAMLRAAAPLVAVLRSLGLRVHSGPLISADRIVDSAAERADLAATGALAVDMEAAALVRTVREQLGEIPVAVVRVIVDTPTSPLGGIGTVPAGIHALRTLRAIGPRLGQWADMAGPHRVVLAAPRSFCAGVQRAIDVVELALQRYPHPVYVRRQIVHNAHVVAELRRQGAVFVEELDEVPDGSTVVFSAHGVAPAVHAEAERRQLTVIDATCPLVTKVHNRARRFLARGDTVFLIGHAGHDETEGTMGQAPGQITLIENAAEAERVTVEDPTRVALLMQTTLAVDEVADTVEVLQRRFPQIKSANSDDICYATTNRQQAVSAIADEADVVIVLGSGNSSNSLRLVEVAERHGAPAHLIDDVTELRPEWLTGRTSVGITAGASAPAHLVDEVIAALGALGPLEVVERVITNEGVAFALPKGVAV